MIGFVNPPPAPPIAVWSAYTPLGVPYAGVPHFSTPATTTYAPLSLPTSSAGASISIAAATMPSPPAPPPAAPPPPAPPPKVYAPGTCNVSLVATAVDSADYPLGTQTFLQVNPAVSRDALFPSVRFASRALRLGGQRSPWQHPGRLFGIHAAVRVLLHR